MIPLPVLSGLTDAASKEGVWALATVAAARQKSR
jgi:hypothetical protein